MHPAVIVVVALFFALLAIVIWVTSMSMDKDRITNYIRQRGGRVVSITWAPFGKGWFGEKNDRIYEVVYYDRDGEQHFATCKTSLLSGVYWTEDRVAHHKSKWFDTAPPDNVPGKPLISQIPAAGADDEADELRRLREENARLREELARRQSAESSRSPEN